MADISPLRRRMIEDMTIRNLSPATQQSYVSADKRLGETHGRSPHRLALEDVRAFQVYPISQSASRGALNQTICVFRFFYRVTLDRAEAHRIVPAPPPHITPK